MANAKLMIKGNQTDLAKLMGVSQPAVSQMVKKGVVQVEPDGKILLEQAVEDWKTKLNVSQQRPFRWKGAMTPSYREQMERYHIARAKREVAKAEMAKIELATKRGELLEAKVIRRLFVDVVQTIRDQILNVPRRVAPELVGIHSEAEIADKINAELETALLAVSGNVL